MKRLILFLLLFAALKVAGQTTGYLRFDTVKIMKQNGTCELYIINKTKDTLGILTNVGGGLTQFRKSKVLNDSTIVVGLDTLVIVGGAGGGGGSGSVTSISQGYGIVNTPNPITSTGTIRADTSGTNGLITRTELNDSLNRTTIVEKPIIARLRHDDSQPDTLALDYGYGLTIETDSTLIVDTFNIQTRNRGQKQIDSVVALLVTAGVPNSNLGAGFRWLVPGSQGIKTAENTATVTWDSVGTNTLRATVPDNAITYAKIQQVSANRLLGNPTGSTANTSEIPIGNGLLFNSNTLKTDTAANATLFNVNNSGRTYPDEGTGLWTTIYDKSAWTAADLGAEFQRGANHTLSLNGSFPRIQCATILWGGASLTRFLPNYPIIATWDKIEVDYQIVSGLSGNVGFGPSMFSNNVNGANFGYTTYLTAATSTGTPHFAKQDGTSDQTGTTFTISLNDVIRTTIEFRDTVAIATFQNLTTGSAVTTITKSFVAGTAPYPPNTGTWGFQNFSGTYEIRRVKISSRKITSPTLMIAFDSKGQIIASPWDRRFPNLLNARYPQVGNYSGGGDQLKDLIDKKIEFSRLNPEQVLIGLGSNDIRYGTSLTNTLDRLSRVVKMVNGSTTRWAITVVPEDSTAGGLSGLTAFKNWVANLYPNNYIDLWTFMSTSNVLKAEFNSGDGVHPNTRGHFVMDSLIAASGFFTTQSPNRRSPYQKMGGGIWATGDSLYGPFRTPLPLNSVLQTNDSNQVVGSLLFGTPTKMTMSPNFPHAQSVSASVTFHLDGLQAYTGLNAGYLLYDRSNTTNFHTIYSNGNILRMGYNGTDNFFFDNGGFLGIGATTSGLTVTPTLFTKKNRTLANLEPRGFNIVADTNTVTIPAGTPSNVYGSKIAATTITSASAVNVTRPINFVVEGMIAGTNASLINPYAFGVLKGRSFFDSTITVNIIDSTTSATGGFVYREASTGKFKITGAPSGGSSDGAPNFILQYSGTQAVTVSNTGTATTIYGTGAGSAGIDGTANITAGTKIVLKGSGTIDTDAAVDNDVQFDFDIGSTTLGINVTDLATGLNNSYYEYEYVLIPVATGSNQDAIYQLSLFIDNNGAPIQIKATGRFPTSFTTTGTVTCDVVVDWVTADAQNNVESNFNTVELFKK